MMEVRVQMQLIVLGIRLSLYIFAPMYLALLFSFNLYAPADTGKLSLQFLEDSYRRNAGQELSVKFHQLAANAQQGADTANDTFKVVQELYDLILDRGLGNAEPSFYFVQEIKPVVTVDTAIYSAGKPYMPRPHECFIPLAYDAGTVNALNAFLGKDLLGDPRVLKYSMSKGLARKYGYRRTKRLIKEHEEKTRFIGQYLLLPATWGRRLKGMQPLRIRYMKFNHDMTKVEIEYSLSYKGETAIYSKVKGRWKCTKVLFSWIH